MKLDSRSSTAGPVGGGNYTPGTSMPSEPVVGNMVVLHSGSVSVLARITEAEGRSYTGEVTGFEHHDGLALDGVKIGDVIPFAFDNLFSFSW